MQLKWSVSEYRNVLIPRLGGLRISWNYLKVIGQHMQDAGLLVMWIESDLLRGNTTEHVMAGKDYAKAKGTRALKIPIQAMWQLLRQHLMNYLQEHDDDLRRRLLSLAHFDTTTDSDELVTLLTMETFREHNYYVNFWKLTKSEILPFTFGGSTCRWWVCACCSYEFSEMTFEICICIRLNKCSHILHRYNLIQTMPGGESYILHKLISFRWTPFSSFSRATVL